LSCIAELQPALGLGLPGATVDVALGVEVGDELVTPGALEDAALGAEAGITEDAGAEVWGATDEAGGPPEVAVETLTEGSGVADAALEAPALLAGRDVSGPAMVALGSVVGSLPES
jgi:hypothetical protein